MKFKWRKYIWFCKRVTEYSVKYKGHTLLICWLQYFKGRSLKDKGFKLFINPFPYSGKFNSVKVLSQFVIDLMLKQRGLIIPFFFLKHFCLTHKGFVFRWESKTRLLKNYQLHYSLAKRIIENGEDLDPVKFIYNKKGE